ncbi:glycosyl hydrolase [Streptomyces profundus]|uniref:glycosyl hydrolase n=1 Tax=Streptomyces profundus TaxID=2867410 RepID=UPI001D167548|nr:glycosyl hydrolase [Streptomyces sp. MA3_2.13]UED83881.1 glycoside hydrolase family 26 protein [Streptomyces sp. MA3_2.13]
MRTTRLSLAVATATVTAGALALNSAAGATAFPPTPKQEVLAYLDSISGSHIVSGQHNKEPADQPGQYTQQVHDITGQWPGLWGGDLMFRAEDIANRQSVIDQALTEWENGSLVTLTWHACPPTGGTSCEFEGGVKSSISDEEFAEIVTEGTDLHQEWLSRLDAVVPYLRQLQDAGVPVLFRPFHEMNEAWNWWGDRPGSDGSSRLFQITHDHLAGTRGLDNLIWVWNVQDNPAGGWDAYYPGDDYVEVASLDVWYKDLPSEGDYQQLQAIAGEKPIALAEMGKVPAPWLLDSQTRWSYFMVWSEQLRDNNSNEEIQETYFHPRVFNQGEVHLP